MRDLAAGLVVRRALISGGPITVTGVCRAGMGVPRIDIAAVHAEGLHDCFEQNIVTGTYE